MNIYTITEFAKLVRRSVKTLQRWDREGKLVAKRTKHNRRYYTQAQLHDVLGVLPSQKRVLAYARVSTSAQKPELLNQVHSLEQFCIARGFANAEFIREVGGGLNFTRKKFFAMMDAIGNREVSHLILVHKDRLVRFGFDWFAHYCEKNGCELLVLNSDTLSPQEELVQDLLSLVHGFSSRLSGLRKYKNTLKEALKDDLGTQNEARSDPRTSPVFSQSRRGGSLCV